MVDQAMSRNVNDILAAATPEQVGWVAKRLGTKTDKAAAIDVGVDPSTVSRWPNKTDLDAAVNLLRRQPIEAVLTMLNAAAIDAAQEKVAGLHSSRESVRQAASTEILDRIIGKPVQRNEHSAPGGGPIEIDLRTCTDEQLERLIRGEDPAVVIKDASVSVADPGSG
jgi:hypothetical protein